MDCSQEVPGGFVVTGGDGAILLELAVEVLDEVATLVGLFVVDALGLAVALWRDHRGFSCRVQQVDDALVGIEGFVGQQCIGCHLWQQRIGTLQIMGLAWRQKERERIAQRIDKRMDFGTQSVCVPKTLSQLMT
jgi:hypothetical protein